MANSVEIIRIKHDGLVYVVTAKFTYNGGIVKIINLDVSNKMSEKVDKQMFFHALNVLRACINDDGHHRKAAEIIQQRLLERESDRMYTKAFHNFLIKIAVMMLLAMMFIGAQALP